MHHVFEKPIRVLVVLAALVGAALAGAGTGAAAPGDITEFPVPTARGRPLGIALGPDGNLWFTEYEGNKVGRITPAGAIAEFPIPTAKSRPREIAAGPDGNLWFTEESGNKVGRITPMGVITEFPVPTEKSAPYGIASGPDDTMWFTEEDGNKIGRLELAAGAPAPSLPSPAPSASPSPVPSPSPSPTASPTASPSPSPTASPPPASSSPAPSGAALRTPASSLAGQAASACKGTETYRFAVVSADWRTTISDRPAPSGMMWAVAVVDVTNLSPDYGYFQGLVGVRDDRGRTFDWVLFNGLDEYVENEIANQYDVTPSWAGAEAGATVRVVIPFLVGASATSLTLVPNNIGCGG